MSKNFFLKFLLILAITLNYSLTQACDEHGKTGIVEENNLWISADQKNDDLTKEVFFKVINDLKEIYEPIIAQRGATLVVEPNWESGTVNAYAQQVGNTWKVMMFGGLARHHTVTPDAFGSFEKSVSFLVWALPTSFLIAICCLEASLNAIF